MVNGKRKGSDREDSGDGKRPRTASGEKKKDKAERVAAEKAAKVNGNGSDAMDVEERAAPTLSAKQAKEQAKSGGSNSARSNSPAVARSLSPSVPKKPKTNASADTQRTNAPPPSSASTTSALAGVKSLKTGQASTSAPTSPTLKATASLAADNSKSSDRRSSLPEGTKKQQQQAELAKVKKEEAETLASIKRKEEVVPRTKDVDMSTVQQLVAEDGPVARLRGHTMPVRRLSLAHRLLNSSLTFHPLTESTAVLVEPQGTSTARDWRRRFDLSHLGLSEDLEEGQGRGSTAEGQRRLQALVGSA